MNDDSDERICDAARPFFSWTSAALIVIAGLGAMPQSRAAALIVDGDLPDGGDCLAIGTWDGPSSTCEVVHLSLGVADVLEIHSATLSILGTVNNAGIIDNYGTLMNRGTVHNSSFVINNASARLDNEGAISSTDSLLNQGTLDNRATGTLAIMGGELSNAGQLHNAGNLVSSQSITNTGSIDNAGAIANNATAQLVNFGTIVNRQTIDNLGMIINYIQFIQQCDGVVTTNPVVGNPPKYGVVLSLEPEALSWCVVAEEPAYDVIGGGLTDLRQTAGDFSQSTLNCLADGSAAPDLALDGSPEIGEGYWYLVRASVARGSTYDTGFPALVEPRDAEITASGKDCPPP